MVVGNVALVLALGSGTAALGTALLWARGQAALRSTTHLYTVSLALFMLIASGVQLSNILTHQFQYAYVSNTSDRSLPTLLLVSTFWAGQAGSLMLWATLSVVFALVLIVGLRRSDWEPYVLTPYLFVTLCIVGLTLASGPFKLLPQPPDDGSGLNPLLQNYWIAIHPPILFTGFTTMAGPFAFAIAALWKRDYHAWVRMARPWALLAWCFLGAGLALGGFWAYESLGWGGFWGWDPVENSSLVPWLFVSALVHGLILQGARGSFLRSNLALAIIGYLNVAYATFLTRSGILGKFSVHSFVELGLLRYLLLYIALFAVLGFGLLLYRWHDVERRVLYRHVLSREFGLLLSVVLFITLALITGIGTSMPVITLLPFFRSQASVDLAWYGPTNAPFGLLLLLTVAIGPLLGWQRRAYGSLLGVLKWPALLTAAAVFVCLLLNVVYPLALLFIAAAVFAMATNAVVIRRIWRIGPLKLGGYLAHIGVGLLIVGTVGTTVYKRTASLQLTQDTPQMVFGRQFTFRNMVVPPTDPLQRRAAQIEVTTPKTGKTWVAEAPYYVSAKTGQLVMHPAIESGWMSDIYIAPSEYVPPAQLAPGILQLTRGQSVSAFGYTLTFDRFELQDPKAMASGTGPVVVEAITTVKAPDGSTATVQPTFRVEANKPPQSSTVTLQGGATLMLGGLDPASQMIVVQFGGVDLGKVKPEDLKGRVFVDVSAEPGINLVWGGFIVGVLGGLLAMLRRWREAHPGPVWARPRRRLPLPRRRAPVLEPGLAPIVATSREVH